GIGAAAGAIKIASGQPASAQSEASAGKRVFKTANCVGCHKWHGGGGGGCPKDASGLHEVGFRYDEDANLLARLNDKYGGTRVGGHPVLVSLLLDDQGQMAGIRIVTDPNARLYMHKKAFLLGQQAKARYGDEGWTCTQGSPSDNEQPVGGVFVKEHCEKITPTRHIIVERDLFRHPGEDLKQFVDDSKITILPGG
ncbi:MAG: c-type cytochrome, partial [Acetobacteraceae bacterium]|nr:c-type cytochrome [Acetobacteraceae bacterium]